MEQITQRLHPFDLINVFTYLEIDEIMRLRQVCRYFLKLVESDEMWVGYQLCLKNKGIELLNLVVPKGSLFKFHQLVMSKLLVSRLRNADIVYNPDLSAQDIVIETTLPAHQEEMAQQISPTLASQSSGTSGTLLSMASDVSELSPLHAQSTQNKLSMQALISSSTDYDQGI